MNTFMSAASTVAASTVAFIEANKASDTASTPFARATLAALIGTDANGNRISSAAMVESLIIAAFGSPKSPATGKAIAKVSGLRDLDGGTRLYQAFKQVTFITDNIDADAWLSLPSDENENVGEPGAGAIRKLATAFILEEKDAPKALFGKTGLIGMVKDAMTDHAKALAKLNGVEPEGENDNQSEGEGETPAPTDTPRAIGDMAAVLHVALNAASDADILAAKDVLAALSEYVDSRLTAVLDVEELAVVNG